MTGSIGNSDKSPGVGSLVDELASSVIGRLNLSPGENRQRRIEVAAKTLYLAALANRPFANERIREEMSALRINDVDVLESCISEAARYLGDDWLNDTADFASVSRASSRLFGFCKEIGHEWDNMRPQDHSRSVMLATFHREDHLIGPALLAQRLRRKGHSVLLISSSTVEEVGNRLDKGDFDCLMVSSASNVGLDNVKSSLKTLRKNLRKPVPFVLGGAVLEFCGDLHGTFEADLVTNDEDKALRVLTGSVAFERAGAAE